MKLTRYGLVVIIIFTVVTLSCSVATGLFAPTPTPTKPLPTNTPTPLPPIPVNPGEDNPDEPVFITGDIPYTSPFFTNTISEPFVLLEDQAGFANRDKEFQFTLAGQALGPVEVQEDESVTYSLALPAIPQGTQLDVDNNGVTDDGVQIFAVAYWSNIWGGPFLEERDGSGWSTAYVSTITDPEREDEIIGGTLIVWAPDDEQSFPTGFGDDDLLFTDDDPVAPIPAGYNIINLSQEPFGFSKEPRPYISLYEGEIAVNDFSTESYPAAFKSLFDKVSSEYPFTEEKNIDWQELKAKYDSRLDNVRTEEDFYRAMRDFAKEIPDAHVGISFNPEIFYEDAGGGFGLVMGELSDGKVIVKQVLPGSPADDAGIETGAEILTWDGIPVSQAINKVQPVLRSYSTEHHKRLEQLTFLTRVPPKTKIDVSFQNPGEEDIIETDLSAEVEYESLFASLTALSKDEITTPIVGEVLDQSGLGYLKIFTFSDDFSLTARIWEHYIEGLIENEVPGLIIDLRNNGGGSGKLASDFAGYFFDEEITLYQSLYYNDLRDEFVESGLPSQVEPGPIHYSGPIVVLVSPDCISACEGFAYALTQNDRAIVIGHYPTAGAFGEVGRGQYDLPDEISMQFPTGRPETPDGQLLIEGVGVVPDITVPVTWESLIEREDTLLIAAVEELLEQINRE
jgi:C-terminal processing protease CtpA/Prc